MAQLVPLLLRVLFFVLRPFPVLSGRVAYGIFSRPIGKRPLSPRAQAVLGRAEALVVEHDGLHLQGYRWTPETLKEDAPTVILAHGWASRAARFTRWVGPLTSAGYQVVAVDGPAHGASPGHWLTMPDYVRILVGVAEREAHPYAIVGHSFGGAAATFAAAGHSLSGFPRAPVSRLVLIAAPDTAVEVFEGFGDFVGLSRRQCEAMKGEVSRQAGLESTLEQWSAAAMLERHPLPTLVIHDRGDDEVPFTNAVSLAAAPYAALHAVEGHGHHRIVGEESVIGRAVDFLETSPYEDAKTAAGSASKRARQPGQQK